MAKERIEIPEDLAAEVQFRADRICCICRNGGRPIQIHHIDENPSNNVFENLAVLCLDCHDNTQIRGGFGRKLDAAQVIKYRNDWLVFVAKRRESFTDYEMHENEVDTFHDELFLELAKIYEENGEYGLLGMLYEQIGKSDLRDKYLDLAIETMTLSDDAIIFYRSIQKKVNEIPEDVIKRREAHLESTSDFTNLGRLFRHIGKYEKSVLSTCRGVINALEKNNPFTAAYYLKELVEEGDIDALFKKSLNLAKRNNDIWWQVRAMDELGWDNEKRSLLIKNEDRIKMMDNQLLNIALAEAKNNWEEVAKIRIGMARDDADEIEDQS